MQKIIHDLKSLINKVQATMLQLERENQKINATTMNFELQHEMNKIKGQSSYFYSIDKQHSRSNFEIHLGY